MKTRTDPPPRTINFNPPELVSLSTITEVLSVGAWGCVIRYLRHDGVAGCSRILSADWPPKYWPPAAGDQIKVVIAPVITLEARPR